MGLFLTADGHFQGWLLTLLCCCAVSQDESPYEKERERSKPAPRTTICNTQPPPIAELPATPVPTSWPQKQADNTNHGSPEQHKHGRPPSLKPLDFGGSSLLGREPGHGRKRSSFGHAKRSSISAPYSFRRLDAPEPQRQSLVPQSLVPVRLGPVILRESPAPQTESPTTKAMMSRERSDSTQGLLSQAQSSAYHAQRDTPFERCQARSSIAISSAPREAPAKALKRSASAEDQRSSRSVSTKRSSSSIRRDEHQVAATLFPVKQPSERPLLRRKGSFQIRKPFADSGDIDTDKEVLELNTIVEERRAEAARGKSGDQYVPAIAPFMQVRARPETLEAIGSAFVTAQGNNTTATQLPSIRPRAKVRRSISAGSRVSGWLSGMVTSHSVAHLPSSEPFYKCQVQAPPLKRAHSEASIGTCLTDDAPSLTAASSPTSKGHSRSMTGESRITPLSPVYGGGYGHPTEKTVELPWPTSPTSAVGLAL